MHNALITAAGLGMESVQVFTKNQRQWDAKPLAPEAIAQWHEHRKSTGIAHVVSHDSYLINLAASNPDSHGKSLAAFRIELERCEALDIPWLVTHPGAHLGAGEDEGLAKVAASLDTLHAELPGLKVVTLLEITAGQGTCLGHRFEHLQRIIELVKQPERLGVCLDTAHMLEAGYDLTTAAGMAWVLDEIDDTVGLDRVRVVHVNDSKTPRGSRVDRHAHIGHGHVSLDAFATLLNHPHFADIPLILETPKEDAPDGRTWDTINLETLRSLLKPTKKRPPAKKPTAKKK